MQDCNLAILQSGNLFVYGINNPVMWLDPSGLSIIPGILPFLPKVLPKAVPVVRDAVVIVTGLFVVSNDAPANNHTTTPDVFATPTQPPASSTVTTQQSASTVNVADNANASESSGDLTRGLTGFTSPGNPDPRDDGTPRNNQAQNRQVDEAVRRFKLSKEGRAALHREISGLNFSKSEIMQVAREIASWGGKFVTR